MIDDQQGLNPIALKVGDGRLHLFVHLIDQVRQIVAVAATRAAPIDLASGAEHLQRVFACRADKGGWIVFAIQHCLRTPYLLGLISNEKAMPWQLKSYFDSMELLLVLSIIPTRSSPLKEESVRIYVQPLYRWG